MFRGQTGVWFQFRSSRLHRPRDAGSTSEIHNGPAFRCRAQLADEAQRRQPKLKVLFTTGYTRNAVIHHGRLDPGVALIQKPFTQSTLAAKVKQALREQVS